MLKQLFCTTKDKSDPMLGPGVYQIPCSYGKSYIGQTGRSFKARLKEHIVDTTHNHISKSVIVEHSHKSKHLICFDQTKILASTPYYTSHIIREALEIEKHPDNFNREDGYKLSHSWKPIIHRLEQET
jgi:predicted GIY-YIG superfamily endonuclease